jgi:hypothetical protein
MDDDDASGFPEDHSRHSAHVAFKRMSLVGFDMEPNCLSDQSDEGRGYDPAATTVEVDGRAENAPESSKPSSVTLPGSVDFSSLVELHAAATLSAKDDPPHASPASADGVSSPPLPLHPGFISRALQWILAPFRSPQQIQAIIEVPFRSSAPDPPPPPPASREHIRKGRQIV